jgi:hypothetical protein
MSHYDASKDWIRMTQESDYVSIYLRLSRVIKSLYPLFHKELQRLEAFLAWGLHMS